MAQFHQCQQSIIPNACRLSKLLTWGNGVYLILWQFTQHVGLRHLRHFGLHYLNGDFKLEDNPKTRRLTQLLQVSSVSQLCGITKQVGLRFPALLAVQLQIMASQVLLQYLGNVNGYILDWLELNLQANCWLRHLFTRNFNVLASFIIHDHDGTMPFLLCTFLQALHLPHLQTFHLNQVHKVLPESSVSSSAFPLDTFDKLKKLLIPVPLLSGNRNFTLANSADFKYANVTRLDLEHAPVDFANMETLTQCLNVNELRIELSGYMQGLPQEASLLSPFTHLTRSEHPMKYSWAGPLT